MAESRLDNQTLRARNQIFAANYRARRALLNAPRRHLVQRASTRPPLSKTPFITNAPAVSQRFPLLDLPVEIVDMVLSQILDLGYYAVMRTSHEMYRRSKPHIHKHVILFIHVQDTPRAFWTSPPLKPWQMSPRLQQIEIQVELRAQLSAELDVSEAERGQTSYGLACRHGAIASFTGSSTERETCYVLIKHFDRESQGPNSAFLRSFPDLTGFKALIVEAEFKFDGEVISTSEKRGGLLRAMNKSIYEMVQKQLEPALGSAIWKDGDVQGGVYLKFQPRRHLQNLKNLGVTELEI